MENMHRRQLTDTSTEAAFHQSLALTDEKTAPQVFHSHPEPDTQRWASMAPTRGLATRKSI
jgi:hypothetical protein